MDRLDWIVDWIGLDWQPWLLSSTSPLLPLTHELLWLARPLSRCVFLGLYAGYLETDSCEKVTEEMIDCRPINSTLEEALFEIIDDCLRKRRIGIPTLKVVAFDGAAVLSSPVNG